MISIPTAYIERIRLQLGAEADAFIRSYEEPRSYGLRLNPLKLSPQGDSELLQKLRRQFELQPVPWCDEGYQYDGSSRPGRHPAHAAGLYYIQEPSAMIAAELLDPQPGDFVLDLAAAPGGKTTQIAGRMQGHGLLIANEIHSARAKILSENVERTGITNAIVTNATPGQLSERLPLAFDRIMLDAPCSGEGMFRKEPEAMEEWSPAAVEMCAARQRDILPDAAAMLKPGGRMVYSTCTFNREENEDTIAWFLKKHPEFHLLQIIRMWPQRKEGEGHFAALLEKRQEEDNDSLTASEADRKSRHKRMPHPDGRRSKENVAAQEALKLYQAFASEALPRFQLPEAGVPLLFGDALYWFPQPAGSPLPQFSLSGMKTPRPGLHLGDCRKGRFEPSHALALAVTAEAAACTADYQSDASEIAAYWRGEVLPARNQERGWGLITLEGHPLGWFKASDGQLKNHYPKGLRSLR